MSNTINGTGLFTYSYARALTQMRSQFDNLSLQLATGQKSQTYGGLGSDRGMALHLKGKLAALDTYATNIQQVSLRTNMMSASLTTMTDIAQDTLSQRDRFQVRNVTTQRELSVRSAIDVFEQELRQSPTCELPVVERGCGLHAMPRWACSRQRVAYAVKSTSSGSMAVSADFGCSVGSINRSAPYGTSSCALETKIF